MRRFTMRRSRCHRCGVRLPGVRHERNRVFTCDTCIAKGHRERLAKLVLQKAEAVSYFSMWLPKAPRWTSSGPVSRANDGDGQPADITLPLDEAIEILANSTLPVPADGGRYVFSFKRSHQLPKDYKSCLARVVYSTSGFERTHWDGSIYQLEGGEILIHWDNPRFSSD